MASDHDNRLLPLRREFGQAWHGFDRNQVAQYLDHLETQLRRLMAERDSAAAQTATVSRELETARAEIAELRERVEELKQPPERIEDLDERMRRTVELANTQAGEIVSRAEAAAEQNWARSSEVSDKLHERYMRLLETLDGHAEALQREHEEALASTRAEVERMTTEAVKRREQLDAEAERKRRTIETEFDSRMTAEREALEQEIAEQKATSQRDAERRVAEATSEAKRLVEEATEKASKLVREATEEAERRTAEANDTVTRLTKIREEARARLREADEVLQQGESALIPVQEEDTELAQAKPRS